MTWMESKPTLAIPRRISGFPYPERFCPHCERELVIESTCHIYDIPEHFKVIFQCHNLDCPHLSNPTGRAYVKVYYSSDYAEQQLFKMLLQYKRVERKNDPEETEHDE